ncbi:MAG: hypothetical protein ACO1TE_12305 [Prosthecobacter sp.]
MNFLPAPILADMADAFGLMDPFHEDLANICADLNDALIGFAFVFAFAGLLLNVYQGIRGGSLEGMFGHIILTGVVAVIIPFFPAWLVDDIRPALSDDLLASLNLDPIGLFENFGDSFGDLEIDTDASALSALIVDPLAIIDYIANIIAAFCMIVIGLICYVIFFFAYQVQICALYVGAAISPVFFGMFLFEETRTTAIKYFTGLVGVCFWPLGWGLGLMLADFLLQVGIDVIILLSSTLALSLAFGIAIEAIAIFCLVIAVAMWIMFVLFKAPGLIYAAVTSGAQIGAAFAGQAVSSGMGGISAGAGVASSVAGMVPGGSTASSAISGASGAVTGVGSQIGGIGAGPPKE